jgi:hypothetical protein
MKKNLGAEAGGFDPRIFFAFLFCATGLGLAMLGFGAPPPAPSSRAALIRKGEIVIPSQFLGDLRKLPQSISPEERKLSVRSLLEFEGPLHWTPRILPEVRPESVTQAQGTLAPMPTPAISFDGMNFNSNGDTHPPDPVGDVGPNHFVQAVNTSIGIYDKNTGAALTTVTFVSLWAGAGTGTPCDTVHYGDPTVIYSARYDRFIVADVSLSDVRTGPYYECIAVSKTSDPVGGGWWRFAVRTDDDAHPWLADYPKMGIWPDGLYMTANREDCSTGCTITSASLQGVRVWAFNLDDLVNGAPLRSIVVDTDSSRFCLLPSNYRGTAPPAGSPNYVVGETNTGFAWEVFKFHVDYAVPGNSTFTGPTRVSQTPYTIAADLVPQPAPGNQTDTLLDRAMMQNQYRNIRGVESLWLNHTTGTASASTPTGAQWVQINVTGGSVATTPVQEQIYNNGEDGLNRFMGSLAVDHDGNMALGFTASSANVAPDIRYVGRLATDPLNTLPQIEVTMLPSITRSVQTGSCAGGPCVLWGDYSAMTIDPSDDCTFWYTNMYFPVQGANWVTRIGSFRFPTCSGVSPTTLGNISTRLQVGTGDNALIGGFIITGTQPKKVIVRGIGPSLGLNGELTDPLLELYDGSGKLLEANDNWKDSPEKQAIVDSTIPPTNDLESAIVRTLPANGAGYTAILRGVNNGTGTGVVEAYDLDTSANSKLANISTRGLVQTGDDVLIAGTIVVGQSAQKVIIRALGPSVPVPGKLANPTLELRDSNGVLLEANDNWKDSPNKQAIIDSTIPPPNDLESAIVRTLPPANYTAIVRGVNNSTGVAVVEVYALN